MNTNAKKIKVSVLTKNAFLFQKIRAELTDAAECVYCESGVPMRDADIILRNTDEFAVAIAGELTMSRRGEADISLPFRIGALRELLAIDGAGKLTVSASEKCARLGGRIIRLTDAELALLTSLLNRNGEFVDRETLLQEVWDDSTDPGVLNVYIHYLREKLEYGGEKIILCSRNHGYRINEKYVGRDAL